MSLRKEIFRFTIIGFISVLIDYLVYQILFYFLLPSIAKGISFCFGAFFTFNANKKITFEKLPNYKKSSIFFIIAYLITLMININVNKLILYNLYFFDFFKIHLAFIFATLVSAIFNFICLKYFVFRKY